MTLRDTPYPDVESTGPTFRPPSHQAFDDFIFAFFAVEMVIKMVALGLFGQKCYLGDTWNRLDFFIVMAGYSSLPLTAQLYEAIAPGVVPYLTKPGWEPCLLRPCKRPWVPKEEGGQVYSGGAAWSGRWLGRETSMAFAGDGSLSWDCLCQQQGWRVDTVSGRVRSTH